MQILVAGYRRTAQFHNPPELNTNLLDRYPTATRETFLGSAGIAYRIAMTTHSFWRMMTGLLLGATLGHTAVLYTFSETGVNSYSFSFLEPSLLDATGAFAVPPFEVSGLTFP